MSEQRKNTTAPVDSKEHQSPAEAAAEKTQEVKFETPLCEELSLGEWVLWEHYEFRESGKEEDFSASMQKVAWWNDIISFAQAWVNMPHNDVSRYFFDGQKGYLKVYDIGGKKKRVNGLSLFKNQIQPEWEDAINEQGGDFRIDFTCKLATLQKIWETLVFHVVTKQFAEHELLCGVRLLDKSRDGLQQPDQYRIEVWCVFKDSTCDAGVHIKQYLMETFVAGLIKGEDEQAATPQIKFSVHKTQKNDNNKQQEKKSHQSNN